MKRILCYGDSNTWGHDPRTGGRYDEATRWTGVLARELELGYVIIEEGLCGRTTAFDDPLGEMKNGRTYLGPCLDSHRPLDLVILMLGTNDLKHRFGLSAFDIAEGLRVLLELALSRGCGREGAAPALLLLAPPQLNPVHLGEDFAGGLEKSQRLAEHYRAVADSLGCPFFDAGEIVEASEADGVHLGPEAHRTLGLALSRRVRALLGVATEDPKVRAMRESIGKLSGALAAQGKGERAEVLMRELGFNLDTTTDLELGRRTYAALRELLRARA